MLPPPIGGRRMLSLKPISWDRRDERIYDFSRGGVDQMPDDISSVYRAFIQYELASIQQYLREGIRLRDMRGASALLDEVNRMKVPHEVQRFEEEGAELIRASGSVTLIGIRKEAAPNLEDRILQYLESLYREKVPGASGYGVCVRVSNGSSLEQILLRLALEITLKQQQFPGWDPDVCLMESLFAFCEVCGIRPVEEERKVGDSSERVCQVCKSRGSFGIEVRRSEAGALARFFQYARKSFPDWAQIDIYEVLPDDFNDLAGSKDLALILADGNRLGATLRDITTIPQYRRFSEGIARAVEETIFDALARHGKPRPSGKGRDVLPWEILFIGGDDILLAVASDIALQVVRDLLEGIEEKTRALFREIGLRRDHLSVAAGVAIASPGYPFAALHALASELESSAKQRAYLSYEEGREESTVDFHRVMASGRVTLIDIRERELRPQRQDKPTLLTRRPFTVGELRDVLSVAEKWVTSSGKARLPRSKMHLLRESLFISPAEAVFAWAHVIGRAGSEERSTWKELETLSTGGGSGQLMPWTDAITPQARATYLLDVYDVYEMIRGSMRREVV